MAEFTNCSAFFDVTILLETSLGCIIPTVAVALYIVRFANALKRADPSKSQFQRNIHMGRDHNVLFGFGIGRRLGRFLHAAALRRSRAAPLCRGRRLSVWRRHRQRLSRSRGCGMVGPGASQHKETRRPVKKGVWLRESGQGQGPTKRFPCTTSYYVVRGASKWTAAGHQALAVRGG